MDGPGCAALHPGYALRTGNETQVFACWRLPRWVICRTGENYSRIWRKANPIDKKHSPRGTDVDVTIASSFLWLPPAR
jgi:hypothetical protein